MTMIQRLLVILTILFSTTYMSFQSHEDFYSNHTSDCFEFEESQNEANVDEAEITIASNFKFLSKDRFSSFYILCDDQTSFDVPTPPPEKA